MMLQWIFIGLLQAVAGDPAQTQTPPAPAAVEAPASAGETPAAEPPALEQSASEQPAAEPQYREERICERLQVSTGERMPRRRCRTVRVLVDTPPSADAE